MEDQIGALAPAPGQPKEALGIRKVHLRRLQACLAVAAGYLLLVGLAAAARWEAHNWGFMLMRYQREALGEALIFHWGGLLVVGATWLTVGLIELDRPFAARFALAVMPLLLLASVDRLAGVGYRPILKSKGLFMAHPTRGWTLRPGSSGMQGKVRVNINSRGLRGPEVAPQKKPGERRILFLGDSVTFGFGVPENECFVFRMSEQCGLFPAGRRLTAINLSVPAYSTWQEYDLLVREGLQYEPDVIVLVFCLNDVLAKFRLVRFGGYTRGYEPASPSVFEWSGLYRMTRAWHTRRNRISGDTILGLRYATSVRRLLLEPDAPLVQKGWEITKDNLKRIVAAARRSSIALAIVCAPYGDQVASTDPPTRPIPQDILAALARSEGIPFLDLLPVFRERVAAVGVEPSTLFTDPLHFSLAGHELAAEAICTFLVDQGFLLPNQP